VTVTIDTSVLQTAKATKGWTDARLAAIAEVGPATVSRILNGHGKRRPHAKTLRRVCDALGLEPRDVLIPSQSAIRPGVTSGQSAIEEVA